MTDISPTAKATYEAGIKPLDYAEGELAILLDATIKVAIRTPGNTIRLLGEGIPSLSCRILGTLLEAGWEMPVWPIPEPDASEAS